MHLKEFHYRWEWQLKASPEMLWQFIADTNRFNYDAGIPSVEVLQEDKKLKNSDIYCSFIRLYLMGVTVEWEEEPFEWVKPFRFGVIRRYKSGPMAEMRMLVEITPQVDGGSHLVYSVWAQPKTIFGVFAIPLQIGVLSARNFSATIRRYDNLVTLKKLPFDLPAHIHLAPGGKARLEASRKSLIDQGVDQHLTDKFLETIEKADDITLSRMRPYILADHWKVSRKTVLDLCMIATRSGILDFRWDVLCPLCRGAKQSSNTLGGISSQVHCQTCNIDFSANFDQLVELTFRPNQAIRQIEIGEYCVGGPQVTPHIIVQQLLQPGMRRSLHIPLETGRYRMRTLKLPGGQVFSVSIKGASEITICANTEGWSREEMQLANKVLLHLHNDTDTEQLFIFERMIWSDQAVTAAEVTATQTFRDLFA
ncbi:MAG: SRPBCC family protein, partial [Patescibacteria group bacterium]|nr:SRPBCC family protein [Patescibacteria group bacterium]